MCKLVACLLFFVSAIVSGQSKSTNPALAARDVNYFQNNKMNLYDIRYMKLNITAMPRSRFISADCNYTVLVTQPLDTFAIEFKQNMSLDSVLINSRKITFTASNNHIYIPLSPTVAAGTLLNVSFYYKGNVIAGFYIGTDESGLDYTASVSESYQAREWFPAKQLLNDKIDSTDVWITTGAAYKAGSNGLLKAVVDMPNNMKQYRWSCRYPLSYYMPSIAVGNYMDYTNYAKPAAINPDSIPVQNFIYNNTAYFNANKSRLDKTPRFIEKMSELYGIYPFYKEKYGHAQADIGGGMEHATMSTMKNFEERLVAHELAHQWFGDYVTCASWSDIWLNESFATYSEVLMQQYLPALFPATAAATMIDLQENAMSQPGGSVYVPTESIYDEGRIFNYRLSYAKGATALHNLRFEMQSDSLFFNTLKAYQQQFKNSFATTEDFKQVAERVTGKDLDYFFNQKIYGQGYPTYEVIYSKHGTDTLVLHVNQTTSMSSVTPLFTGLMEYRILSADGDTIIKLNQTTNTQIFKIPYTKTPRGVVVDPNNWILNKVGVIKEGPTTMPADPVVVKVYPNPVKNSFTISMPPNIYNAVRVLDINGRVLANYTVATGSTVFKQSLNVPAGLYFLHLLGSQKSDVYKVLVTGR